MGRKPEGGAEKEFKKIGKKIDNVIESLKSFAEDARYKDRIEELKNNGRKLKSEIQDFKNKHKAFFNDVDNTITKTGDEIKKKFSKTFKKR